ncbi:ATP-binding protein [Paenibacillus sp. FSL R7-0048]|uniref:histidine kinase n=2 Tax=Paenibacillus TaxID=44249 RepID=A0ABX3GU90_9BACL|nr:MULTISPECIES: ATP-binding protein [Paenibacillus]MDH6444456.1 two-component system sporulation sensor kinase B [Paenibacillus sp. PastF-4]MDH6427916.1 two-component system sporulation sensor kinase B [Paenibacillus sp. PastH-4]MDH6528355.1 two-component system sporulation sensor kinase B [Paenibacillus sp. PastH-3]OMC72641.1 two-component sensor histidine kinase [Paenibacillus odorifer]OMC73602.1 two-component sensor histidine kinase [Paenibacillus odorifer]
MFETLLLNFLFLLFPVLTFLIFFENRAYSYNRLILVFMSAVTMSLCIAKPIRLEIGYIFDLRYIPFIIVALFGGYRNVLPLYIILNAYRFYVGGGGVFYSFLFATAILILVPLYKNRFLKLPSKGRVIAASLIALLIMGVYLLILGFVQDSLDRQFWILSLNALTTHVGVMSVIMILIEKIISNIKNRERIVQSERLNVVSELAASVSHEIRNPLTVTSGFLQLLNKSKTMTPEEKGFVELSLQELQRAEKIVSDYLSFAKPQSENMVYSNMKAESEYTKNIIMPYATMHKVDVQFSFNNSLNKNYDRNQIQQCLINLYKNGIEAMKETDGGTLFIDIFEKKQNIMISIKDNGVGMTKDEISRLGKPYYSTKAEGTGLGMLMVYSTVDKVKGTIEVDSEKGKGTTFLITIPT